MVPTSPVSPFDANTQKIATLLLKDGTAYNGISFGAEKSVAGECVFQTGMVGYPESLTDPSYRSQILVFTFPLAGNYGVPSRKDFDEHLKTIPKYFESSEIHVSALVVAHYGHDFSHYLAASSLSDWCKESGVPAIYGVDTRALTKKIREQGSLLAKVLFPAEAGAKPSCTTQELAEFPWLSTLKNVPWKDPNAENLVAQVSTKKVQTFTPPKHITPLMNGKRPLTILAIDVGMKNNQIRCFTNRGCAVTVVPWDYDFTTKIKDGDFDGLFISNGPGDPVVVSATIERIAIQLKKANKPVFGICLGHQLMAIAAGGKTSKMKFGNRGHNIPCTDMHTGRCYITSQNHGYAVDVESLPSADWEEYFLNANDNSNEGIIHKSLPYFSVQFHPESTPGPWDTEYLFDKFIKSCVEFRSTGVLKPLVKDVRPAPPIRHTPKKVLVLGSGGLSIGQAGEFDYSGSQAIKALKEENIYTILINPNIATIQTSKGLADKVYFLPVTPEFVRRVIKHEKPEGIYCTFGGQTALNVGVKLKNEFAGLGVTVLGTPIETIEITEDRELFAQHMAQIGEKCALSRSATDLTQALVAADIIGYPLIVRAAYALGGLGSGFANNKQELTDLCNKAFATSPQVLVEKSMKGWKEIEYEVVRDASDNCVTVCNMENFDPLGIHTGDSIVVAPSQTLSDEDYMMLRRTAINVIRHLGVVGECNIQYALNPRSKEYCIIEVNARLSRSSALASKATGYPLAFVAAKLGLGIPLTEVKNNVTKKTIACFEPSLDYVVVKIPRWDLKKFSRVSTKISSAMKSVGEVMSIGRTFEETIQKAIRSVDFHLDGFSENDFASDDDTVITEELANPSDQRLFAIANSLYKGYSIDKLFSITYIDRWFLNKLKNIVDMGIVLKKFTPQTLPMHLLKSAKQIGFSDRQIGKAILTNEMAVRKLRIDNGITPFVKQIDTVAAEFPCFTNYLYITYNASENDVTFEEKGVMVLGSGVYRIGSSVEFDWCAVRCIRTLRQSGTKTIMVNYNPETVSTDYDEADRLYFENLTLERVLDIYQIEQSSGVVVCMGGQTPNNIALPLHRENVNILGTSPEQIDKAENRYKFSRLLDTLGVDQPQWKELTSLEEATAFCMKVEFPVLVRPSYVLSGAGMNVVYSIPDLKSYLEQSARVSREHPVVITKFIEEAKEIEWDAVSLNGKVIMHVISEHVENAGVHSGDATLILPPQDLDAETVRKIEIASRKISNALNITGPFNIQFIAKNNEIKVIECNVRASRSFPFCSKVIGVDLIEMATKAIIGLEVAPYPLTEDKKDYVAVKVPQFSFGRLQGADPILGVEMASTGEVACFGKDKYDAYLKALLSTGFKIPKKNVLISIGSFKEKLEFLPSVQKLHAMGFKLFATSGTADFIQEHSIPVKYLESLDDDHNLPEQRLEYSLTQHLTNNLIDLYVNLPSKNQFRRPASYMTRGYRSRRMAVDLAIPLITNIKCAKLFIEALSRHVDFELSSVDFQTSHENLVLPGLINIQSYFPNVSVKGDKGFEETSKAALAGGFSLLCNMPVGEERDVSDKKSFVIAEVNCQANAYTDFSLSIAATKENALGYSSSDLHVAPSLYIGYSSSSSSNEMSVLSSHFKNWPLSSVIVANANNANLGTIILLSNLYSRPVHISNVFRRGDIELIGLCRGKGSLVTCDVSVYNLFLTVDDVNGVSCLGTKDDVDSLWQNLDIIDCFSVGDVPYKVHKETGNPASSKLGYENALPLLFSAVLDGRLSMDDIKSRFHDAPNRIFGLPEQLDTYIEVEIDRFKVVSNAEWSPFADRRLPGIVHRVVIRGETVYLDGTVFGDNRGRNVAGTVRLQDTLQITNTGRKSALGGEIISIRSPTRTRAESVTWIPHGTNDSLAKTSSETFGSGIGESVESNALAGRRPSKVLPPYSNVTEFIPSNLVSLISKSPFYRKHVVSVSQFTRADLHILFNVAQELRTLADRQGTVNLLNGRVLCSAFYEPSTRTSCSFEAAMVRLGGNVVSINQITSSISKGETIADTVRTLASYGDLVVIRHPEKGSVQLASKYSPVPIINAGDGTGEHPSQAFLDAFTIREELGTVNGLTITLVGDLKNGRTVHSLVKLLIHYDVKLNYVSPVSLKMPDDVKEMVAKYGIVQREYERLEDVIEESDVVYVTRIQKERFSDLKEYEQVVGTYCITNKLLLKAKRHMIVMHPLPRVNEIDPEVDLDQRAAYFRQMKYGLYVRMALLVLVCGRR